MTTLLELFGRQMGESLRFAQDLRIAGLFNAMPMTCPICHKGPYKFQGWAMRHYQRMKHAWWEDGISAS